MGRGKQIIRVGSTVRTMFLRGECLEVVNGRDVGWFNCKYYLVKPMAAYCLFRRPHWVREDELGIKY